jgi:hypothetical protein
MTTHNRPERVGQEIQQLLGESIGQSTAMPTSASTRPRVWTARADFSGTKSARA